MAEAIGVPVIRGWCGWLRGWSPTVNSLFCDRLDQGPDRPPDLTPNRRGLSPSRAPVKTGEVLRMEVSYGEGLAIHIDPESCAVVRKGKGEALTGVRAGRVLSREKERTDRGADAVRDCGRPHLARRYRERSWDPARSETPCMYGCTSLRNREIPRLPREESALGRIGKLEGVRR